MTTRYNPPFDKRITSVYGLESSLKGKSLTRGRIVQAEGIKGQDRYGCNFLYNPSAVSAQHNIDTNIVVQNNPLDKGVLLAPLQQSVSFSLLFDRTYELWDRSYNNKPQGQLGVLADVLSLYYIVGIALTSESLTDGTSVGDSITDFTRGMKPDASHTAVSPMVYTPVWVYFGGPLKYYGVIESLNVTYSHWTQNMIPARCAVDVSITLLPKPSYTQQQGLDEINDFNKRVGGKSINKKTIGMADINRADYGGVSGR